MTMTKFMWNALYVIRRVEIHVIRRLRTGKSWCLCVIRRAKRCVAMAAGLWPVDATRIHPDNRDSRVGYSGYTYWYSLGW